MADTPIDNKHEIHWNPQLERILASEGERALCFSWLHTRSEKRYDRFTTYVTLPSIVLSTVNGFIAATGAVILKDPTNLTIGVGIVSMSVGMINTITSYFGWAKRTESHRMVSLHYARVHRSIMLELALPRDERIRATDFLKIIRNQLDRLHETSPPIPDRIIHEFKVKFADTPEVSKPQITNGLDPIEVYVDEGSRRSRSTKNAQYTADLTPPGRVSSVSPS